MRRSICLLLLALLFAALLAPVAHSNPWPVEDTARAYSVTPPGQDGTVTAMEFAAGDFGPHYDDQLEMYASLIDDDDVSEEELETYFHPMQLFPEEPGELIEPKEGVDIYRDQFGVPHVYGNSLNDASFGLGYVTAEDRLFQMDVFRHAARGTLAEFLGEEYLQMDIDTRREGYTEEEIQQMHDRLSEKFGDVGITVQQGLQAYADGVNAYIEEAAADPTKRPVEYEATGNPFPDHPQEWTVNDTLFIVVLQLRVFGETAGGEVENAGLFAHLREKLGKKKGKQVYNELFFQNDPDSPTTIARADGNARTQRTEVDFKSVAIPDKAEEAAEEEARRRENREMLLEALGFKKQASNALVVPAAESASGNPLLLGGPQVGHSVPSFFLDIDVHAPGIDFRGPAVPGTSALIPLGRGTDYAWTLTTGYSDAVDTRAELLCNADGSEPTVDSTGYMFKGECLEMESRTETFTVKPPPTQNPPEPPSSEEHTFYRTQHGPVFMRGTVKGKPVAFVKERFFWKKEIDSIPSFYKWNTDVDSLEDFAAAAQGFTMSFNAFYADSEHAAYFHVGHYPRRAQGVHPSLPTWGTGAWEWKGRRSFDKQPTIVDPGQGFIANWNNKPTAGWRNSDSLKWGSIQRVQVLHDEMTGLVEGEGQVVLSDLADVIRIGATTDTRARYLGPAMLRKAQRFGPEEDAAQYDKAVDIVTDWVSRGAHRKNADRDGAMDDGAALAIYDRWYDKLVHRIFDDEVGSEGYELFPGVPLVDYSPTDGGGFWFDFSSYLHNLFNKQRRLARYSRNYCNNISTPEKETCAVQIVGALTDAIKELEGEQESGDPGAWTTDAENLSFSEQGAGSVDAIPWQNRGSENHLVEILSDADDQ